MTAWLAYAREVVTQRRRRERLSEAQRSKTPLQCQNHTNAALDEGAPLTKVIERVAIEPCPTQGF